MLHPFNLMQLVQQMMQRHLIQLVQLMQLHALQELSIIRSISCPLLGVPRRAAVLVAAVLVALSHQSHNLTQRAKDREAQG